VVRVFERAEPVLQQTEDAVSNVVLSIVRPGLEAAGFDVETGKRAHEKIKVPVLFGRSGVVEKAFEADAWNRSEGMILEVEASRGVTNNQFLKDLFQACMMQGVDYCGIAVRNQYAKSRDFERALTFFETLYASRRLQLPLKGVLLIGYSIRGDVVSDSGSPPSGTLKMK
jgi:hypothetical protein